MSVRPSIVPVLLGCVLALGCSGEVSEPGGFDRPYRPGGTIPGEEEEPTLPPEQCALAPAPLRRISHQEYRNTVRDLFPTVAGDLDEGRDDYVGLPAEPSRHEFDNDLEAVTDPNLVESYVDTGSRVAARLREAGDDTLPSNADEAEAFVRDVGRRLFRRPLTDEQVTVYSTLFADPEEGMSFDDQVEATLTLMLSAPEFLYRLEEPTRTLSPGAHGQLDGYSIAGRMASFLWESTPDETLLQAARDGDLATEAGVRAQAERMLDDPRARDTFVRFHAQWLDFDRLARVTKPESEGFDDAFRASMRTESEMFVGRVMFDGRGTLDDLLTSDRAFVDQRLAEVYGVPAPAEDWTEVTLPNRAGVLTQATFLASHAHPDKASPVLRGVFLLERIMCSELGAPPANAEAMGAAALEGSGRPLSELTNRERYDLMVSGNATCQGCHLDRGINPIGFSLENYDTMGRYIENDVFVPEAPIDASATFEDYAFSNGVELAAQLAASERVERCAVEKWVRFAYGGGPMENAGCFVDDLVGAFRESGGSFRDLQLAIVTHPSFAQTIGAERAE